ncbi:DUF924-domain-containing protein [Coniochaeta ligniaria NRRL 30616]|uniref:DUF924-domain-containing protein n=1 Tax=Coniochaeta ligniaria NRRL 30616 TaxID=1408157 RepID=A0A1J7IKD9_9PEZI|nr:DUF924-domain-containing protein [Coniochaeta ligniaria NRRL 30616]
MALLRDHITPSKLEEVVEFWFEHLTDEHQLVAPPRTAAMRWFKRDEELDKACVTKFGPCLEAIRSTEGVTADDLLALINQTDSRDWVGLVLILDQIPRNIYRGEQSKIPFTVFDPLAQEVVKRAIKEGVFDSEYLKRHVAYRSWFLFPFMHSEDAGLHASCVKMCEDMIDDAKKLSNEDDRELAVQFVQTTLDYEKRHQTIIERFGRYPHRNKVLGRQTTPEEEAFLRDGGDTFGG